jgi:hypothetical protein
MFFPDSRYAQYYRFASVLDSRLKISGMTVLPFLFNKKRAASFPRRRESSPEVLMQFIGKCAGDNF